MDVKFIKGHASMLFANILFGGMAPVSKAVLLTGMVGALSLTTFRMFGAALLFWIASFFCPKEHVNHKDLKLLFFAALFGIVLNQGPFIWGMSMTSPIDASIVATTTPIIAMIIAAFYLKEPITGKKVLGIFVGATGALLLIMASRKGAQFADSNNVWGDLLCLFAQFSFSFYIVVFKDLVGRYRPVTIMKWMFTYSAICYIPLSYSSIVSIDFVNLPLSSYLEIAYIVVCGTFFAYLLIPIGQHILRPTVACMYNYVQPIIASLLTVLWGMDRFDLVKGLAIGLVFLGVFIVTKSRSKADMDAYTECEKMEEKH